MIAQSKKPSTKQKWFVVALAAAGFFGLSQLEDYSKNHMFLINQTNSLPHWALWITKGTSVKKGEILAFVPPNSDLVIKYFGEQKNVWGKYVYGLPGDVITHKENEVFIGEQSYGKIKPVSLRNEKLAPGPTGIIPNGCYYVGTPHKDSFDSRYSDLGLICGEQIIGKAVSIL